MIKRITYSVEFPTTGVKLSGDFKPQPGITAVIGPNESGKTFSTIEVTRYLLFGKKALRGAASDYKKLDASGEFIIRGHGYTVKRNAKKEVLLDATNAQLAVGAEEVTNKIVELLGYGLNVFDIANASVQKQADLFGQMKPAERKRLIDEVVGLLDQEKVEKEMRAEATTLAREAEAMLRVVSKPTMPIEPEGYLPSSTLQAEFDDASATARESVKLKGQIVRLPDVVEPSEPRVSDSAIQTLSEKHNEFLTNRQERTRLQTLLTHYEPSPYTQEQLEIAAQRLALTAVLAGQVTCPDCGSEFVPGEGHVHLPDGPDLAAAEIRTFNLRLSRANEMENAKQVLSKMKTPLSRQLELEQALATRKLWEDYDKAKDYHASNMRDNAAVQVALDVLGDVPTEEELEYMRDNLTEAKYYERMLATFTTETAAYKERSAEIAEYQRRATAFKDGNILLSDARATVKSYLSPAISTAASNLMHHMTKGKHSTVVVDEDMNVMVGTQALDTLSGGAATVANLALRLALGQVLVAESFPVFLGDEMDSDADGSRRETVADALQSLVAKQLVKQIILITHRGVDIADHVLDLEITQ